MWLAARLIFYIVLFIGSGVNGFLDWKRGGIPRWLDGFVFCSSGDRLFGTTKPKGLLEEVKDELMP